MSGRGGKRPGGGRPPGARNKATADVRALALPYGPGAISLFAQMAGLIPGKDAAESEQARIAAAKELVDRAYGKATQAIQATVDAQVWRGGIDAPRLADTVEEAEVWLARRRRELAEMAAEAQARRQPAPSPPLYEPEPVQPQTVTPQQRSLVPTAPVGWGPEQEQAWQRRQEREESERLKQSQPPRFGWPSIDRG
jgi:hypothetical protein